MKRYRPPVRCHVREVTFAALLCLVAAGFFFTGAGTGNFVAASGPTWATPRPAARRTTRTAKYSQFPHDVKAHRVSCDQCHKFPSDNWKTVRSEATAFPDITEYPKHESCLNCHKQQFFKGTRPTICSICHTNPSPRNSTRHAFANPREIFDTTPKGKTATSDFAINFPHDKHIEIVAGTAQRDEFAKISWLRSNDRSRAEESCSVCHQTYKPQGKSDDEYISTPPAGSAFWLKKGTFKTSPIGHTTCFTCHSADTGILPSPESCATCHTLRSPDPASDLDPKLPAVMAVDDKITLDAWRRRNSSATFRHEWFSHAELSCSTCHNVATMNTADPSTKRVSITSCAACHVTATTDDGGVLNFEIDSRKKNASFQCVKCHVTFGKEAVPVSHINAVTAAK